MSKFRKGLTAELAVAGDYGISRSRWTVPMQRRARATRPARRGATSRKDEGRQLRRPSAP
jgi:hypothetical protein